MKSILYVFFTLLISLNTLYSQNNTYIKPKIYAVIVGISNYQDSNIPNLKFPEKDAQAFYNFLRSSNAGAVPEENISLLTGQKATRRNILKEVLDKFSRSGKEDMIIFYFSGHGKAGYNEIGYLLNYDAEYDNDLGTALSMAELKSNIESFQAKMKVSYVDACHAGLFTSKDKGLLEDDNAVIAKTLLEALSKSDKGSVTFLASSARQQSQEDEQLDHGVFTYYLLKGLKGEADQSQPETSGYKDGFINISELNTYLSDSIPRHTKYKQKPSVDGKYNDQFPLSVLRANLSLPVAILKTNGSIEAATNLQKTDISNNNTVSNPNKTNNDPAFGTYKGYQEPCIATTGTIKLVNKTQFNASIIVSDQKVDLINNRMSKYEITTVSAYSNEIVPALKPGLYYVCLIDRNSSGFGDPVLQSKKIMIEACKESTVTF